MTTDELIDHVQKKLEETDARLTTKMFHVNGTLQRLGRRVLPRGELLYLWLTLELESNEMPEEYQKNNDVFVKTFYERLEIKKKGWRVCDQRIF
ncbi:uncharacterized protein EAF02_003317 [Botrytis sinoallii]|uniref:uncharacterized protein n=1 Tax=Botrytis sinoallii TaxID=1463999 RepID=UPI0018FFED2A|nr:uncharacterized protein EAF02_003317 [Botrytis sinoallii]KAF7886670.1 hypothetical protein EAF02_003317 [Botrytis sinoallii]